GTPTWKAGSARRRSRCFRCRTRRCGPCSSRSFERVLEFLGESVPDSVITDAVRRSDPASMKQLEDAQATGMGYRSPRGDRTQRFVHSGLMEPSLAPFGDDFVRRFDRRFGVAMARLGYPRLGAVADETSGWTA